MSYEEEFDRIIRQKGDEAKYPFDENNWIRASRMLDAERKAEKLARIKKFFIPSAFTLAVAVTGVIAFNYFTDAPQQQQASVLPETRAESALTTVVQEQITEKEESTTVNAEMKSALALSEENTTSSTSPDAINQRASSKPATLNDRVQKSTSTDQITTHNTSEGLAKTEASSQNNNNASLADKNLPADNIVNTTGNKPELPGEIILKNQAAQGGNAGSDEGANEQLVSANPEYVMQEESIEQLFPRMSYLPYELSNPDAKLTAIQMLQRYNDDYYSKKRGTQYFNVEAGATYLAGWKSVDAQDAKGFNWYFGFNYDRYLTEKLSVGLGLQSYNIDHISQSFFNSARKNYSFGSTMSYTIITTTDLYYTSVPVRVSWDINSSNRLSLGANFGYLLGAKNIVETYDELDNAKVNYRKIHNTGIYEGVNYTNIMLSAAYRLQMAGRFHVNMELNYGLTDIFGSGLSNKAVQNPVGLRIGLQYTLFEK